MNNFFVGSPSILKVGEGDLPKWRKKRNLKELQKYYKNPTKKFIVPTHLSFVGWRNKWIKSFFRDKKIIPCVGLEPTTFGLEVQRAIHCASRACRDLYINIPDTKSKSEMWQVVTKETLFWWLENSAMDLRHAAVNLNILVLKIHMKRYIDMTQTSSFLRGEIFSWIAETLR